MNYFIGLDIGTTATKASLFDENLKVLSEARQTYPLYRDQFGMAEEDADEIFEAVLQTIQKCGVSLPKGDEESVTVCFSSQMHSLIGLKSENERLTRVITWADTRSDFYVKELKTSPDAQSVYERTGTPIHPMSPLSKLIWIKAEKRALYEATECFLDIKGYIFYRLFGVKKIDLSIASGTGLFSHQSLQWDEMTLQSFKIDRTKLPEIVSPYEIEQTIKSEFQKRLGLSSKTVLVWGAGDGPMANLGVGAVEKGRVALTIGTSGAIRKFADLPQLDDKGQTFCYALDEKNWVIGGAVNSGGDVVRWLSDTIFEGRLGIDEICELAAKATVGSKGLIFHPYLGGERAPLWDAAARGDFFGLSYLHDLSHLSRAVLEGIIFNLYQVSKSLGEIDEIFVNGGFTQSELWLQILADVFNKPVFVSETQETGCLAAALMAQKALGLREDFDIKAQKQSVIYPILESHLVYQELFAIYERLTQKLSSEFAALADFQKNQTAAAGEA